MIASYMESHGVDCAVQIMQATYEFIKMKLCATLGVCEHERQRGNGCLAGDGKK